MSTDYLPIRQFSESETKEFLRSLLNTGQCIPFIGTGFTGGERAFDRLVPNGLQFMEIMRNSINDALTTEKPSSESLKNYSFQDLSDEYFREPIVEEITVKNTLKSCFTRVRIESESKKSFLRWDWPYIYTLNIDDAIENEVGYIKVLPYQEPVDVEGTKFVYKLHGDAADAIATADRTAMKLIFGTSQYIESLRSNKSFLSALSNDYAERHLLFVGCSLTDELDLLYALSDQRLMAQAQDLKTKRLYITSKAPETYEEKKKLKRYGITDVIIVDYSEFYSFVGATEVEQTKKNTALAPFEYEASKFPVHHSSDFLKYLLQLGWPPGGNSTDLAVDRKKIIEKVNKNFDQPLIFLWGRRFSGRTTLLNYILNSHRERRRFFVPSALANSDGILNAILKSKDSIVAVDSGVLSIPQLDLLAKKALDIRANNCKVIIASSRGALASLGINIIENAVEVPDKMAADETIQINRKLDPFGISKNWATNVQHLENIFRISESPVVASKIKDQSKLYENINRLHDGWNGSAIGKLEFAALFYLGSRQRLYSRSFRQLAVAMDIEHAATNHFFDFSKKWEPFVEVERSDKESGRVEHSFDVIVANSSAWIHYSIRKLAFKLGAEETSSQIVKIYRAIRQTDKKAFDLLMFDNLNAIFTEEIADLRPLVIKKIYSSLSNDLSSDPDYWLQHAKGLYYVSSNVSELRLAVEYCEKSIIKKSDRTKINAKLTKANLLGKICKIQNHVNDDDLISAIKAYSEAINTRISNPVYINELLEKSSNGKGYMAYVCKIARSRKSMFQYKADIDMLARY